MSPKVSVIMSVYNSEKYLRESIESVLNQTFKEFEFIIINDCSNDNSVNILNTYLDERIVIINNDTNLGLSKSFNKAISISKSDLILRMDSDDICYPNRIEVQYNHMIENPKTIVLGSNADVIDMNEEFVYKTNLPKTDALIKKSLKKRATFIHPTVIFRKDYCLKVGGYYEPIKHYFEDFVLWNQLSKYGNFEILDQSLIKYRVVCNSISTTKTSPKYIEIEREIAKRGFAYDDEIDFIFNEKKAVKIHSEEVYLLLLSKKALFENYNPKYAREKIKIVLNTNKASSKAYIFLLASYLPKHLLSFIFKFYKKHT
jgi:glycosyltransferase involved in cell wall biosynthesis